MGSARCWLLGILLVAGRAAAIANGDVPTEEEFTAAYPWAVVLSAEGRTNACAGSLISPRYVLTAAHCAKPGLTVLYGSRSRAEARRVPVREVIRHPQYTSSPMTNDIALLRLARPLRLKPVPIAGPAEAWLLLRRGSSGTILGWGGVNDRLGRPELVRVAEVTFAELGMVGTHIAFYSPSGGPCGGDSGGPLVIEGHDGQSVLVGIASVTDGSLCATGGGRSGYTRVPLLLDFIRRHVSDLPERAPPLDFDAARSRAGARPPGD